MDDDALLRGVAALQSVLARDAHIGGARVPAPWALKEGHVVAARGCVATAGMARPKRGRNDFGDVETTSSRM